MNITQTITEFMDDLCESAPFAISPAKALDEFTDKHADDVEPWRWNLSQKELLRLIKTYLTKSARSEQLQLNGFSFPRTLTVPTATDVEGDEGYVYVPLRIATVEQLIADQGVKAENVERVQREYAAIVERNAVITAAADSDSDRVVDVIRKLHGDDSGEAQAS